MHVSSKQNPWATLRCIIHASVFASAFSSFAVWAANDVYVCREASGTRVYQNTPGGDQCQRMNLEPVLTLPQPSGRPASPATRAAVPPPGPSRAPNVRPDSPRESSRQDPPRIDPAAAARDTDRLRILEDELRQEEARLQELQSTGTGRGDAGRQQDILRSQASIEALRREIAKVRR